jgi:putative transposase
MQDVILRPFSRRAEGDVGRTETFSSFEEAYNSIDQFINDYNTDWILHRLEYCSPVEYREKYAESQRKVNDDIPSGNKNPEVQLVLISSGSMPRRNEIALQAMVKGAITYSNTPSINPSV